MAAKRTALLVYPDPERYTTDALLRAFKKILPDWKIDTSRNTNDAKAPYSLQYSDYDEIDWDEVGKPDCLTNSYMLRKALIRKSYLSVTVQHYLSKNPTSILGSTVPATYPFQITHADELDELFCDELYDLRQALDTAADEGKSRWWILKPAMADKGQGIRLFDTQEALLEILESFEDDSDDDEEEEDEQEEDTKVRLSSMRDWVIQEYISAPLLIDPLEGTPADKKNLIGRKFHLRVYVLAVGALQVYVYTDILALFASAPYSLPGQQKVLTTGNEDPSTKSDSTVLDLAAHLTNTCLQTPAEAASSVFLLSDLVGKTILSPSNSPSGTSSRPTETLAQVQVDKAIEKIGEVVRDVFRAALGMPNHFTVAENGFEVFGIDFLLSVPSSTSATAQEAGQELNLDVHLLEINACPDFKQSGDKLHGVIQGLFEGVLNIAVRPFFESINKVGGTENQGTHEGWALGQSRGSWLKCADEKVGKSDRPW